MPADLPPDGYVYEVEWITVRGKRVQRRALDLGGALAVFLHKDADQLVDYVEMRCVKTVGSETEVRR